MLHTPAAGTLYYRVTQDDANRSSVLSGVGSFYTPGGRYNRPHQRTVYASDDALVAITEMAYYQALKWQNRIGGGQMATPNPLASLPPTYPLESSHLLWCFSLAVPPSVLDVDDPIAYTVFQHAPIEILNPGQAYERTQSLADRVRAYTHPHYPRAEEIIAPSVRTPVSGDHQPSQYALFVMSGKSLRGKIIWKADLTLEFLDQNGNRASRTTRHVAWTHPRFQLHGLQAPIPAFTPRPGSQPINSGQVYPIEIRPM
jgi:hypothetical protein